MRRARSRPPTIRCNSRNSQLDRQFNAAVAAREIEEALGAGDIELARSFLALAAERDVAVAPALTAKVESAEQDAAKPSSKVASFARGFVTGKPEDVASAAGMLTGDLFVFGDVRDVVREGWRGMRGEEVDKLVLGLAGDRHRGDGRHVC